MSTVVDRSQPPPTVLEVTSRDLIRVLTKLGAIKVRQAGSHARFVSACGKCATTVPIHPGDIKRGTLMAIEKDMTPCYGKGWVTR